MQADFHYYATYCAAYIAGYSHEESMQICYAAQFTDCCTAAYLEKIKGPKACATTQLQMELMDAEINPISLQNIVRIWSSFHFLPYDLYAKLPKRPKRYLNKYRLLCRPNGELVKSTVELAKSKPLTSVGIAMHVLADTWAHGYFAGVPSLVINNTNSYFYEHVTDENGSESMRKVKFNHNPASPDNMDTSHYTNTIYQGNENSIMNLGHGRCGHLPDYSCIKYTYMPAWYGYEVITKDNPHDYYYAFCQMVYAMKYLRGDYDEFELETYDEKSVSPWKNDIVDIIRRKQTDASADWKKLGQRLSGETIDDFDISKYESEYVNAEKTKRDDTFLGSYFIAAMAQKSMVTGRIFKSGNVLAGFSVDYSVKGFKGIKDFKRLIKDDGR